MVNDHQVAIEVCFYGPSRPGFTLTHVNSSWIRLGKSASSLWAKHFVGMHCYVLVYDVNNANSFESLTAGATSFSSMTIHMIQRTSLLSSLVTRLSRRKANDRYDSLCSSLSASTRYHRLRKSGQWRGVNSRRISRTLRHLPRRLSMSSRLSKRYRVRRCNKRITCCIEELTFPPYQHKYHVPKMTFTHESLLGCARISLLQTVSGHTLSRRQFDEHSCRLQAQSATSEWPQDQLDPQHEEQSLVQGEKQTSVKVR